MKKKIKTLYMALAFLTLLPIPTWATDEQDFIETSSEPEKNIEEAIDQKLHNLLALLEMLPDELALKILKDVPVKHLLRLKETSRKLNRIIQDETLLGPLTNLPPALQNFDTIHPQQLFFWAAENGHRPLLQLAQEKGIEINQPNNHLKTALHLAAQNGHTKIVKLLLTWGANVDAAAMHNITPLHLAAANGHTEIVTLLLNAGANINARNTNNETPLHQAAQEGRPETAQLLLERGADINARTLYQETPLRLATINEHRVPGHEETRTILSTWLANRRETPINPILEEPTFPNPNNTRPC